MKEKKQKFSWLKLWVYELISLFLPDYNKIPEDIGDRVIVSKNMIVTREALTVALMIEELGSRTPVHLVSELNDILRSHGNDTYVDFVVSKIKYDYDPSDRGLQNRVAQWENQMNERVISSYLLERVARLMYTVDKAREGTPLFLCRITILLHNSNGMNLFMAKDIVKNELAKHGTVFTELSGVLEERIQEALPTTLITAPAKEKPCFMSSNHLLAQTFPFCGSYNDDTGIFMGLDISTGIPYYLDVNSITSARVIYITASAGGGKTVMAQNMLQSAFENGSVCIINDIKGNEYTTFIKATGGYIVSLRGSSTEYINTWVMHKEDLGENGDAESYFNSRVLFSVQQMLTLSQITEETAKVTLQRVLENFLKSMYSDLGVSAVNMNSWASTLSLNPFVVYDKFRTFVHGLTDESKAVATTALDNLGMFMSKNGSHSYIFSTEYDYKAILNAPAVVFDFGLQVEGFTRRDVDFAVLRLKMLYMERLNSELSTVVFNKKQRTFKILEESQIVSDEIMRIYAEDITMRRAQRQDILLIGNSVAALNTSQYAAAIMNNIRGLLIGETTATDRGILTKEFDLQDYQRYLEIPGSTPESKNAFVFINKMEEARTYPLLKVMYYDGSNSPTEMRVSGIGE